MISTRSMNGYLGRQLSLSALIYAAVIVVCCLTTVFMLTDIVEQYRARNTSLEMFSRLEGRNQITSGHGGARDSRPLGSPFLEGQTVTVASAALLQRVTSIVANAGGTVVSSEIVQQGTQSKDGYVTAITNCELEQEALQKVLYDIEAGLPFLFVDQLDIQAPSDPGQGGGRLRVLLGVTALWPGIK